MTLAPGTTLGPYRILSQLGAGGMGVVYQATDPRLKRTVAIKLLPPDLTSDDTAKQRFLQEAQAASALDHPNICTIHEINETDDGQLYLVMAHYEGETLKERIGRGPLELDDAIAIATQVGEGLAKAHAAGIVHRDIKPANLMMTTDGTVKILDFGLAKLAGSEGVTQTGTTIGTVAYMSPEQAQGQDVDQRTDIWSLGVVLHEMLAGEPPFQGENLLAISNAITGSNLPSLTGSSSAVQPIVTKALNKDKAQRYQAASDLLTALQALGRGSATVATVSQTDVPSIAVLPFTNMSADPEQEYFCDGMAEEILNALSSLNGLRVSARTSSFKFRGQDLDATEIGFRLKVGSVLEGSVRKAGNRLRITAQLINVGDGFQVWSERYDRTLDDVFAVQDEIAHAVVEKLRVRLLTGADVPIVTRPTDNLEAYNLYLKGRYYFGKFTGQALNKALEYFGRAVALEPAYAQAHAGVSHINSSLAAQTLEAPHSAMPKAKESALKALGIDDRDAYSHFALAQILDYYEWNWTDAEREHRRALELNPGEEAARAGLVQLLAKLGRGEEAIAEARSGLKRNPVDPLSHFNLAFALGIAGQSDAAIAQAQAGIELEPGYPLLYLGLGLGLAGAARYGEAVEAFKGGVSAAPDDPLWQGFFGWGLGLVGQKQEALRVLSGLERRRAERYTGSSLLAYVNIGLGDHEGAISHLHQAAEERDGQMTFLKVLLLFDPLRSDPRFQVLLQRMNFPTSAESSSSA